MPLFHVLVRGNIQVINIQFPGSPSSIWRVFFPIVRDKLRIIPSNLDLKVFLGRISPKNLELLPCVTLKYGYDAIFYFPKAMLSNEIMMGFGSVPNERSI